MPPIEAEIVLEQPQHEEIKPKIGIIYPPPEVRNIVDKTASFVARNGPEFESRIRQNEINNTKFNFLNSNDPYHTYYQHKVKEFAEGRAVESSALKPSAPSAARLTQDTPKAIQDAFVPQEPPTEFEFVTDPPSINALDLDIVKLTAQFVARNGRQFLTQLMNREQRNYQFDFLRPQHSLFNYFTKLVEQYTKILIPPKDLVDRLSKEVETSSAIMDQVRYRVDWHKYQERQKKREEEATERERVAYAMIDWHDFVVVETVDFQPHEVGNFPTPTTPEEVGARVLAEERGDKPAAPVATVPLDDVDLDIGLEEEEDDMDDTRAQRRSAVAERESDAGSGDEDMEQSSEEDEADEENEGGKKEDFMPPPPPPPLSSSPPALPVSIAPLVRPNLPPNLDQVIIRRDYDPKSAPKDSKSGGEEVFLVSPFTGEKIPASQVPKHIRVGLLDQKWLEQRDRESREKRDEEQVFAPGTLIESSLKQLAERRTDIFGIGVDETAIGKKLGEEDRAISKPETLIWDGHSGSMESVTKRARESITAEAQKERLDRMRQLEEEREKTAPVKPAPPPPPAPAPLHHAPPPPVAPASLAPPPPPQRHMLPPSMMGAVPPMQAMPPPPPRHVMMMQANPMQQQTAFLAPMQAQMQPPPRPPPMMAMQSFAPPPGDDRGPSDMGGGPPPNKKARTEDSLMPEHMFLRTSKNPVTFRVQMPESVGDKPEWKLSGQIKPFTLPLTETVATIKALIADDTGMPGGKQKLHLEGLFLKDTNTLAFYNVTPGMIVTLQPKERGGRKK